MELQQLGPISQLKHPTNGKVSVQGWQPREFLQQLHRSEKKTKDLSPFFTVKLKFCDSRFLSTTRWTWRSRMSGPSAGLSGIDVPAVEPRRFSLEEVFVDTLRGGKGMPTLTRDARKSPRDKRKGRPT